MNFHAVFPELSVTATYHAEVWGEMETWLKEHCQGSFRLLGPCEGYFQDRADLDRFAAVWHGGLIRDLQEA